MKPSLYPVGDAGFTGGDLVSVITAAFNAAPFLEEAIQSVLDQTYARIEMIVVDDGSQDNTWKIIESFGSRVIGIRQNNQGVCHARIRGAAAASGSYLLFLDADDVLGRDLISSGVSLLQKHPRAIAMSRWRRLVKRGEVWTKVPAELPLPPRDVDSLQAWLMGFWVPICCLLWPRAIYDHLGGWDHELTSNEDGDLVCRALATGVSLMTTETGEAFYRSHGDNRISISTDVASAHRFRSRMRVLEKLGRQLEEQGMLRHYAESLGIAWHRLALAGFEDHPVLARECLYLGRLYAGKRSVSRTLPGRVLTWLLGLERKEALVQALARHGIVTRERRRFAKLRLIRPPLQDPRDDSGARTRAGDKKDD